MAFTKRTQSEGHEILEPSEQEREDLHRKYEQRLAAVEAQKRQLESDE